MKMADSMYEQMERSQWHICCKLFVTVSSLVTHNYLHRLLMQSRFSEHFVHCSFLLGFHPPHSSSWGFYAAFLTECEVCFVWSASPLHNSLHGQASSLVIWSWVVALNLFITPDKSLSLSDIDETLALWVPRMSCVTHLVWYSVFFLFKLNLNLISVSCRMPLFQKAQCEFLKVCLAKDSANYGTFVLFLLGLQKFSGYSFNF